MSTHRSSSRTVGLFLLTSFLFGSSFVAIKIGVTYIPPLLFAALRFIIGGGLLLLILMTVTDSWFPRSRSDLTGIVAVGLFIIGLQNAALNTGIQYVLSAAAAIVFSLIPLLTTVLVVFLIPEEHPSRSDILGILIGFVGVGIVVRPSPQALLASETIGYSLVFIVAIGVSLGSVLLQRTRPSLGIVPISAWGMILGGGGNYVVSLIVGESAQAIEWTLPSILALAYLSTAVATIEYTLFFSLIQSLGSHKANRLGYLDPVVAAIVGWVLLGETIAPLTLVGLR